MALPPIIVQRGNGGKAAQRASERQKSAAGAYHYRPPAPALPPILHAHAPPARSYRSQAAAGAYHPPPHAKYSPAGLPPAPSRHYATPSRSSGAPSGASRFAQKQAVTGQIIAAWFALQSKGLFPRTATPPTIKFDSHETPGVGAYVVRSGSGLNEFHVPPSLRQMLAAPKDPSSANWARSTILHELAHTAQNKSAHQPTKAMAEGGAQAFAQDETPKIYGTPPVYSTTDAYRGYTDQVQAREPPAWVTHGQFVAGAPAPEVNMPGSRAFRGAMHGVGRSAGQAAENRAVLNGYLSIPQNLPIGNGARAFAARLAALGYMPEIAAAKASRRKGMNRP